MIAQAVALVLTAVFDLFILAALVRFWMQVFRAPSRNPIAQFSMALTDFAVKPVRRVVPGLWGMDLATLTIAWLTECVLILLVVAFAGRFASLGGTALVGIGLIGLLEVTKIALWMVILLQFMLFVVSFANPHSPYMPLLNAMNRPFARRIQKILPPIGNIDLSPMVVVLLCSVLLNFILPWLAGQIRVGLM